MTRKTRLFVLCAYQQYSYAINFAFETEKYWDE